jgi:hypothetical protein
VINAERIRTRQASVDEENKEKELGGNVAFFI